MSTHETLAAALRTLPAWASVPLLLAAALLAAKAVDLLAVRGVRRVVRGSESEYDDILFEELHAPVVASVVIVGVLLSGEVVPAELRATLDPVVGPAAVSLLVVVWARTANRIGNRLLGAVGESGGSYASFAPIFSNLLTLAVAVGGLFALFSVWRVDVTPFVASAGIAGIAVGFAAKDTVANFFGGLALYVDRTYKLGDYIVLDSGEAGTVVTVGIRSTTVLTRDEVMVTVPNAALNAARVVNESAPQRRKRIRVPVGVAYGTDLDALEALLTEVALAEPLVLDSPRPRVRFLRFGDSALDYEIRCWVRSPTRETKARHALNRELYARFAEAGVEIPYPQREVTLRERDGSDADAREGAAGSETAASAGETVEPAE